MAVDKTPVSMSPSIFKSPKSIENYSIVCLFFIGNFVDSGKNLVSSSGVTRSYGKTWLSVTAYCLCWFCGLG